MLDFQNVYPRINERVGWCQRCGLCVENVEFDAVGIMCPQCNVRSVCGRYETMEYFLSEKRVWSCLEETSGHSPATSSK